jgi:hypothetical protein
MRTRKTLLVAVLLAGVSGPAAAMPTYSIDAAANDETFIINGEVFKAKTYCLGWDKGDRVGFLDGSALGACVSATLYNFNRGETCRVWCE